MQNAQGLNQKNGCNKYVCKYIWMIDENNYIINFCNAYKNGLLKTHAHFMPNTKIVSSKANEGEALAKKRYANHPRGCEISLIKYNRWC